MSYDDYIYTQKTGPLATVRSCRFCAHTEIVRKGLSGVGRGYGMRAGNKARGRMIQHVKSAHPSEYAKARKEAADRLRGAVGGAS